jgi:hypothetical protein
MRQDPLEGLVAIQGKEKQRRPLDPPPIVEMVVNNTADPQRNFLQNPYYFMTAELMDEYAIECGKLSLFKINFFA